MKPGISPPIYPARKIADALDSVDNSKLVTSSINSLDKNDSDRKFSNLHHYKFENGSEILSVLARVRKKDDFKIESYGLLTKNISPIYMKSPRFLDKVPYSMIGLIENKRSLQTCIVPLTAKTEQVDVRLSSLTSTVKLISGQNEENFLSKILGFKKRYDYSCLVLTYKPAAGDDQALNLKTWNSIVQNVQRALAK